MAARGIGVKNALLLLGGVLLVGCTLAVEFPRGTVVPTPTPVPVVSVPAPVRATAGVNSLVLDWPPVPGAFAYNVYLAGVTGVTPEGYASLPGGVAYRSVFPPLRLDAANGISGGVARFAVVTALSPTAETGPSGEVHVVPLSAGANSLFSATPGGETMGDQADAQLGWSVAKAGDLDADGREDFAAGAFLYSSALAQFDGRVYVYLGSSTSGLVAAGTLDGLLNDANFGMGMASAGDLNGDGFDDLWIGAPYNQGTGKGFVSLYGGGEEGLVEPPLARIESSLLDANQNGGRFGRSLSTLDMNGDGRRDLAVGAHTWDHIAQPGAPDSGAAFVYLAPPVTGYPAHPPAMSGAGATTGDAYAFNVAGVGDTNGDGKDDLIAGQAAGVPSIFLFKGAAALTGNPDMEDFRFNGPANSSYGGWNAAVGDVNNDGYDDFVTGIPGFDGIATDAGRVELWLGRAQGQVPPVTLSGFQISAGAASTFLGRQVESGDINGDGFRDLLVGARGQNGLAPDGRVFVYLGVPGGFSFARTITLQGSQAFTEFGHAFNTVDFNGDGSDDILVGAPRWDPPAVGPDAGALFLYYGPPNHGPTADAGPPVTGPYFTQIMPAASFVDAAPPGTTHTCHFDWGDGTELDLACADLGALSHQYGQTGTFNLTLRVDNGFGLFGESVSRAVITAGQ